MLLSAPVTRLLRSIGAVTLIGLLLRWPTRTRPRLVLRPRSRRPATSAPPGAAPPAAASTPAPLRPQACAPIVPCMHCRVSQAASSGFTWANLCQRLFPDVFRVIVSRHDLPTPSRRCEGGRQPNAVAAAAQARCPAPHRQSPLARRCRSGKSPGCCSTAGPARLWRPHPQPALCCCCPHRCRCSCRRRCFCCVGGSDTTEGAAASGAAAAACGSSGKPAAAGSGKAASRHAAAPQAAGVSCSAAVTSV